MNAYGYVPLVANLEGRWETPLPDLPLELATLVEKRFSTFRWDQLDAQNRRSIAAQIDYQHDPNHEPATFFELVAFGEELKDWIARERNAGKDSAVVVLREVFDRVQKILDADRERVGAEIQQLRALNVARGTTPQLSAREATYLNIIGALLELALGKTPAGKPQSVFESQAAIIEALLARHADKPGISKTTLEAKFADARRRLNST